LEISELSIEYVVKQTVSRADASISLDQREAGRLHVEGKGMFTLLGNETQSWTLCNKEDGEVRPFSMIVVSGIDKNLALNVREEEYVLKIKDNLFEHNGSFYSLGGIPEGRPAKAHLMGSKIICRLVNFPFSQIEQVDQETKHQLKRYRGIYAGEFYGLGSSGFHVKLENDLDDIGLPLAASSYLICSTA
jgi:hypothetical protein